MNTRGIAEEINDAVTTPEMRFKSDVDVIQAILDRHLEGKAVVPRRLQMREGDLFVLMETLHKGRTYCIANYVAAHKFAKYPDDLIAMTAQEMFHSLDSSLIAEAEKP